MHERLLIERLGIDDIPEVARLDAGVQYAAVIGDADRARWLADVVTGLDDPPPNAVVWSNGPVRLVPADGGLLPHLTVLGNLVRAHRLVRRRVPRTRVAQECQALAGRCGLDDVLDRYPYELTPGRCRLAGAVRALCAEAAVIVLEDAPKLPTWGELLDLDHHPDLLGPALLLITPGRGRAAGFRKLDNA